MFKLFIYFWICFFFFFFYCFFVNAKIASCLLVVVVAIILSYYIHPKYSKQCYYYTTINVCSVFGCLQCVARVSLQYYSNEKKTRTRNQKSQKKNIIKKIIQIELDGRTKQLNIRDTASNSIRASCIINGHGQYCISKQRVEETVSVYTWKTTATLKSFQFSVFYFVVCVHSSGSLQFTLFHFNSVFFFFCFLRRLLCLFLVLQYLNVYINVDFKLNVFMRATTFCLMLITLYLLFRFIWN